MFCFPGLSSTLWIVIAVALALGVFFFYCVRPVFWAERPVVPAADVNAFLKLYRVVMDATRRPLMRIALEDMAEDDLLASKVGGQAWWPEKEAPPVGANKKQLFLLAQINFSDLSPPLPGYPEKGMLQFFIADNGTYGNDFRGRVDPGGFSEQRNFRVVYWPDLSVEAGALPLMRSRTLPHAPDRPRRMTFHSDEEAMSCSDHRFNVLLDGEGYEVIQFYATTRNIDVDALEEVVWENYSGTGHKLGGYPYFTQEDPRSGGDLELLLQLDSDDKMMWGDAGVANFFISPQDLARADFRRVLYSWDCT